MPNFWKVLNKVISDADVIVEVLDARSVEQTRNVEIEDKVLKAGKKIIFALNKCDLTSKEKLEKYKRELGNSVFVSAKDHHGTLLLKKAILKAADYSKTITVGLVGYPNTGKSSLISTLVGRSKAKSSSESGFTKGLKKIRLSSRITLIDTPGVIPYKEKDNAKHGTIGSIDYSKIKDPENVFFTIFDSSSELIKEHYNIEENDPELFLESVAKQFNFLKKGSLPDTQRASRRILKDWQTGEIKSY